MMSETPPKDIIDKWEHCARRFGALYAARYLPEKTTPYMHVFVYHVGFFLRKLGNIECFANYDIESWHRINKRVKSFATVAFGGRTAEDQPKISTLGRQQLHHQYRTQFADINAGENGQQTKRKREEEQEDQNLRPTKRRASTQTPSWTERRLNSSDFRNPFFESVMNEPTEVGVDVDSDELVDTEEQQQEEVESIAMTLIQIQNNAIQLYNLDNTMQVENNNNNNEKTNPAPTNSETHSNEEETEKIIGDFTKKDIAEVLTILETFWYVIEDTNPSITEQHH